MSIQKLRKKRGKRLGRPPSGQDPLVSARLPRKYIDALERWARRNKTTRSEAIRRAVEIGLKAKK